jgi:predicted dehydrogenase
MTYRAALIGCGKIGSEFADDPRVEGIYSHAGAYDACSRTALVAVCDADIERSHRCGGRWGVTARYTDAAQLLREQRPEIVSLCTPDQTHASLLRLVLESPGIRAVLAEKPLALSADDAAGLVEQARRRGVILAVNYIRRYASSHQQLRNFLASGGIGDIQSVIGAYTKGIFHNGTHWFDLARYLVGEIVEVRGIHNRVPPSEDPTLDACLKFENGARGYLHGCDAACFTILEMDLLGTLGRVRIADSGHRIEFYDVKESPYYSGYLNLSPREDLGGGFHNVLLNAVEDLVECLEQQRSPRCSGEDGLAALKIAAVAHETASQPFAGRLP